MAITFPTIFQSAITTDPAATAAGYLTPDRYNQGVAPAGMTAGQILYPSSATALTDSANLTYSEASGPRLTVGSGNGTSAGFKLGYAGTTGWASLVNANRTPDQNEGLCINANGGIRLYAPAGQPVTVSANNQTKYFQMLATAGQGIALVCGTATTDVQALSATQTWNASGVTFKANKTVVTPTAYAAASQLESWEFNTGQAIGVAMLSEVTTIAAAATTDTTIQIPANVIVLGVSVRVTTVIPTAATFTVTGTTSGTAFQTGATVSTAANTTDVGTKNCPYLNATAQTVRFTPNVNPADNSGRVRVTIHYLAITAPTS